MNYYGLPVTASTTTTTTVTYPAEITPPSTITAKGSLTSCMVCKFSNDRGATWSNYTAPVAGRMSLGYVGGLASTDNGTIVSALAWGQYSYMSPSSNTFTQLAFNDMTSGVVPVAVANTVVFGSLSNPSSIYVSLDNSATFSGPYPTPFTTTPSHIRKIGSRYIIATYNTNMVSDATKDIYVTTTGTKAPSGTYRNLGTVDHISGKSLWIRTA
jgi:hypothetical protein